MGLTCVDVGTNPSFCGTNVCFMMGLTYVDCGGTNLSLISKLNNVDYGTNYDGSDLCGLWD